MQAACWEWKATYLNQVLIHVYTNHILMELLIVICLKRLDQETNWRWSKTAQWSFKSLSWIIQKMICHRYVWLLKDGQRKENITPSNCTSGVPKQSDLHGLAAIRPQDRFCCINISVSPLLLALNMNEKRSIQCHSMPFASDMQTAFNMVLLFMPPIAQRSCYCLLAKNQICQIFPRSPFNQHRNHPFRS